MRELDALKAVRALLDKPEKWTQGAYAKTRSGIYVASSSPNACKWCLSGAINRATQAAPKPVLLATRLQSILIDKVGRAKSVCGWNDKDERTYEDVINLLDDCIADLEEHKDL